MKPSVMKSILSNGLVAFSLVAGGQRASGQSADAYQVYCPTQYHDIDGGAVAGVLLEGGLSVHQTAGGPDCAYVDTMTATVHGGGIPIVGSCADGESDPFGNVVSLSVTISEELSGKSYSSGPLNVGLGTGGEVQFDLGAEFVDAPLSGGVWSYRIEFHSVGAPVNGNECPIERVVAWIDLSGSRSTRASLRGRVVMGEEDVPIEGARIEVRRVGGSPTWRNPSFGVPTYSDSAGEYVLSGDDMCTPGPYQVRASIPALDPTGGYVCGQFGTASSLVVNHPEWDPGFEAEFAPWDRVTEVPDIRFPEPVLLHAGWGDSVCGFDELWSYLRLDPEESPEKSELRIPAFLASRVPSTGDSQAASSGYINEPKRLAVHSENVRRLLVRATEYSGILEEAYLGDAYAGQLPISLVGHSYGGVISMGAISLRGEFRPHRFLSLDSPLMGSDWAAWRIPFSGVLPIALTPAEMVGISPGFGQPPVFRGWSLWHSIRDYPDHLVLNYVLEGAFFDIGNIVRPDESAFGSGQTRVDLDGDLDPDVSVASDWHEMVGAGYAVVRDNAHAGSNSCICEALVADHGLYAEYASFLARGERPVDAVLAETRHQQVVGSGSTNMPRSGTIIDGGAEAGAGSVGSVDIGFYCDEDVVANIEVEGLGASYRLLANGSELNPGAWSRVEIGEDEFVETVILPARNVAGVITLEVTAGPLESADAHLRAVADSAVRLDVEVSWVSGQALIEAQLVLADGQLAPLSSPPFGVFAVINTPVDPVFPFPGGLQWLWDNGAGGDAIAGDGVYSGLFTDLASPGRYHVECYSYAVVDGLGVAGRRGTHSFSVEPAQLASMSDPVPRSVDADGDGALEGVEFAVDVSSLPAGEWALRGRVVDQAGMLVRQVASDFDVMVPGSNGEVVLSVSSEALHAVGTLSDVRLVDLTLHDRLADMMVVAEYSEVESSGLSGSTLEPSEQARLTDVLAVRAADGRPLLHVRGRGLACAAEVWLNGQRVEFDVASEHALLLEVADPQAVLATASRRDWVLRVHGCSDAASLVFHAPVWD